MYAAEDSKLESSINDGQQLHPLLIQELIKAGANVNTRNKKGKTALMEATWNGKLEVVRDRRINNGQWTKLRGDVKRR